MWKIFCAILKYGSILGIETIKRAVQIGAKGIVGEAGKMLFLNRDEAVELAEKNNLFIMGIKV